MKLSIRGMAIAIALVWAGSLFFTGVINRFFPDYGWWFLKMVDSIYPGYIAAYGLKNLIVGVLYALLDGAIAGALFAWIYNMASGCCGCKKHQTTDQSE